MRLILVTLFFSSLCFGTEYLVISNKKIHTLTSSQIKAVFLKKTHLIKDIKIIPVNLEANNPLRIKFEKELLQMSFIRLKSYWNKQHYHGKRPPISMKSQKSIINFVKKVDGAIAYIEKKYLEKNLHILYRWED